MKSGDNGEEDPPVPIPNTEVKLFSAEDTWRGGLPGKIGHCRFFWRKCPQGLERPEKSY